MLLRIRAQLFSFSKIHQTLRIFVPHLNLNLLRVHFPIHYALHIWSFDRNWVHIHFYEWMLAFACVCVKGLVAERFLQSISQAQQFAVVLSFMGGTMPSPSINSWTTAALGIGEITSAYVFHGILFLMWLKPSCTSVQSGSLLRTCQYFYSPTFLCTFVEAKFSMFERIHSWLQVLHMRSLGYGSSNPGLPRYWFWTFASSSHPSQVCFVYEYLL